MCLLLELVLSEAAGSLRTRFCGVVRNAHTCFIEEDSVTPWNVRRLLTSDGLHHDSIPASTH